MARIHTITLNPAIDRLIYLDKYRPGVTNRISTITDHIGGKGTHVSINLDIMGLKSRAFGIVFGKNGDKITRLLNRDNIEVSFQKYENAESRMNYLIVEDSGKSTCLSEKGVMLSDENIHSFIEYMDPFIYEGDYLVLSGDASNCPDPYVYNAIMKAFTARNVKVFMDVSGEKIRKCIKEKPFLIKPNLDELEYLCERRLRSEADIKEAVDELIKTGISIIALSLGEDGSLVYADGKYYRVKAPGVNVKNTIGCGDCFLSGLIYGIFNQWQIKDTLAFATAVSASAAESTLSVGFDPVRAEELKGSVSVNEI